MRIVELLHIFLYASVYVLCVRNPLVIVIYTHACALCFDAPRPHTQIVLSCNPLAAAAAELLVPSVLERA